VANCILAEEFFGADGVVAGFGINGASMLLPGRCFMDGDTCDVFIFGCLQDAGRGGGAGGGMLTPVTAYTAVPVHAAVCVYTSTNACIPFVSFRNFYS